jgi:hypothetical protein
LTIVIEMAAFDRKSIINFVHFIFFSFLVSLLDHSNMSNLEWGGGDKNLRFFFW